MKYSANGSADNSLAFLKMFKTVNLSNTSQHRNRFYFPKAFINPFILNVLFLYPLKTSENRKVL